MAACQGHVSVVRFLVEAGAAKDHPRDFDSVTALGIAAQQGPLDTVRVLAEKDIFRDYDTATPLWIAAQGGHLDVVGFLLEIGAAKDQADHKGATPLFGAASNDHLDIVCLLLEVGADKDHQRSTLVTLCHGETPLWRCGEQRSS